MELRIPRAGDDESAVAVTESVGLGAVWRPPRPLTSSVSVQRPVPGRQSETLIVLMATGMVRQVMPGQRVEVVHVPPPPHPATRSVLRHHVTARGARGRGAPSGQRERSVQISENRHQEPPDGKRLATLTEANSTCGSAHALQSSRGLWVGHSVSLHPACDVRQASNGFLTPARRTLTRS